VFVDDEVLFHPHRSLRTIPKSDRLVRATVFRDSLKEVLTLLEQETRDVPAKMAYPCERCGKIFHNAANLHLHSSTKHKQQYL
jgi:hypothetical protein